MDYWLGLLLCKYTCLLLSLYLSNVLAQKKPHMVGHGNPDKIFILVCTLQKCIKPSCTHTYMYDTERCFIDEEDSHYSSEDLFTEPREVVDQKGELSYRGYDEY